MENEFDHRFVTLQGKLTGSKTVATPSSVCISMISIVCIIPLAVDVFWHFIAPAFSSSSSTFYKSRLLDRRLLMRAEKPAIINQSTQTINFYSATDIERAK